MIPTRLKLEREIEKLENRIARLDRTRLQLSKELNSLKGAVEWMKGTQNKENATVREKNERRDSK